MQPLGAIDYLMISQVFNVVIIRDIPVMTRKQKSQARRFITLIDTLYDNKVSFSLKCFLLIMKNCQSSYVTISFLVYLFLRKIGIYLAIFLHLNRHSKQNSLFKINKFKTVLELYKIIPNSFSFKSFLTVDSVCCFEQP